MKRLWILLLCLWPTLSAAALDGPLAPGAEVAFVGLTFIDTSGEGAYFGARDDETARVGLLEKEIRQRFEDEGFVLVPIGPEAEALSRIANPAKCYGCEVRAAERLGADYVVVGEVQKVSNLILSMNLVMRTVPEGEAVRALAVDIRSNTDDSWLRGMRYILDNHYFPAN